MTYANLFKSKNYFVALLKSSSKGADAHVREFSSQVHAVGQIAKSTPLVANVSPHKNGLFIT